MEHHIQPLIPDYVLGFLPESDRRRLESHINQCPDCQQAVAREQGLELLVRQTVQLATQPIPARLQALHPAIIPRRRPQPTWVARQLAPVMLFLVLLAGVALQARLGDDLGLLAPGFYRAATPTATSTSTPTATIASLTRTSTAGQHYALPMAAPLARATTIAPPSTTLPANQPGVPPTAPTPVAALPAPVTN